MVFSNMKRTTTAIQGKQQLWRPIVLNATKIIAANVRLKRSNDGGQ